MNATFAQEESYNADAETVKWQQLEFQFSKRSVSGKLQFKLTELSADQARTQLLKVNQGQPLMPRRNTVSLLHLRFEIWRNHGEMRIWMDPVNYRVYQRERETTGRKRERRLKHYRFLQNSVYRVRKELEFDDPQLDSTRWKKSSEQFIPLFADGSSTSVVQDPSALLLLASSAALKKPSDSLTTYVFTDKHFYAATLTVADSTPIKAEYYLTDDSGSRSVDTQLNSLQIELKTRLLGLEPEEDKFEFLGLNAPVVIYVDPKSRLPLRVEGRQRLVRKFTADLRKVTMQTK